MDWLKNFDLRRWWIAALAAGVAITITAATRDNHGLVLVGLGITACGFGEWVNHRMEVVDHAPRGVLTTFPRFNRPHGTALVVLGVALMAVGVFRLIIA